MNDYVNAPATKMLATHCLLCGRPLLDSVSVQQGLGPECRKHMNVIANAEHQELANKLIHLAAIAVQNGKIQDVLSIANAVEDSCQMPELAKKIRERFSDAVYKAEHFADITIFEDGENLLVKTPYRRGEAEAFRQAWRNVPGRRWISDKGMNMIPKSSKLQMWTLLRTFFPGKWGIGPKGVFRVPVMKKVTA